MLLNIQAGLCRSHTVTRLRYHNGNTVVSHLYSSVTIKVPIHAQCLRCIREHSADKCAPGVLIWLL